MDGFLTDPDMAGWLTWGLPIAAALFVILVSLPFIVTQKKTGDLSARLGEVVIGDLPRRGEGDDKPSVRNAGADVERRLKSAEARAKRAQTEKRSLRDKLAEAGLKTTPAGYFVASFISATLCVGLMALMNKVSPVALISAAIFGGLGLPRFVLSTMGKRRMKKFLTDLPDAIETMVRSIKSGLPISEAMVMIAREFEGPIRQEFSVAVDEQRLGLSLAEALDRVSNRVPLPEMRMLAMAIRIQSTTGGSLSETLLNLSNVIRGRDKLARKVKAVSAEARTSAAIMAALPMVVMGAMYAFNPDYVGYLFQGGGLILLIGCGIWMSIGTFIMWRMVNFKV